MAKAFLKVILSFIASIVGIVLAPIDLLIANAFPNISQLVNDLNFGLSYIWNRVYSYVYYIVAIFPPQVLSALKVYIGILLITYTITLSIHLIIKVIRIIQNIKFW